MLHFAWERTEAVHHLGGETFDVALFFHVGEPAIKREPHRQVGDIVFRNEDGRADGDLRRPAVGDRLAQPALALNTASSSIC